MSAYPMKLKYELPLFLLYTISGLTHLSQRVNTSKTAGGSVYSRLTLSKYLISPSVFDGQGELNHIIHTYFLQDDDDYVDHDLVKVIPSMATLIMTLRLTVMII